jgi:hypothetical protein
MSTATAVVSPDPDGCPSFARAYLDFHTGNRTIRSATKVLFVIPTEPRISYFAAPSMTTYAAFIEESRMKFANATKPGRKSGGNPTFPTI